LHPLLLLRVHPHGRQTAAATVADLLLHTARVVIN
jgi:hypothetical protein